MPPSHGGRDWFEYRTARVVLTTDFDTEDAKRLIRSVEQSRQLLPTILGLAEPRELALPVVAFRDDDAYARVVSATSVALVASGFPGDIGSDPTIFTRSADDQGQDETIRHELTHRFLNATFGDVPVWFTEGLARYSEAARVNLEAGTALLGGDFSYRALTDKSSAWTGIVDGRYVLFTPIADIPDPQEILRWSYDQFYVDHGIEVEQVRLRSLHYFSAYQLVHFFLNGTEAVRELFLRAVSATANGTSVEAAFNNALVGYDLKQLARAFREHLNRTENMLWQVELPEFDFGSIQQRRLPPDEVLVLLARIEGGKGDRYARTQALLDEALTLNPQNVAAHLALGTLEARHDNFGRAQDHYKRALGLAPKDPKVLHSFVWFYSGELARTTLSPTKRRERLRAYVAELSVIANTTSQLDDVAWLLLLDRRAKDAIAPARRAIELDPTCTSCFDTLACALFESGDAKAALQAQKRVVAASAENASPGYYRELTERLKQYLGATRDKGRPNERCARLVTF